MVYDERIARVVLFGGGFYESDTWWYDTGNNTWTMVSPPVSPSPRRSSTIAFDSTVGKSVMFGGWSQGGSLGDTWSYDGTSNVWAEVSTESSPPPLANAAMSFDRDTGAAVMFSGHLLPWNPSPETWTFSWESPSSFAATVRFWDGEPGAGGLLIATRSLVLEDGKSAVVGAEFQAPGTAGTYLVCAGVEPEGAVDPDLANDLTCTRFTVLGNQPPVVSAEIKTGPGAFDSRTITVHMSAAGSPNYASIILQILAADEVIAQSALVRSPDAPGDQASSLSFPFHAESQYQARVGYQASRNGATPVRLNLTLGESSWTALKVFNSAKGVEQVVTYDLAAVVEEAAGASHAVGVDASGSYDVDGAIASVEWQFGDGTSSLMQTDTHQYADAGTYSITLTVCDNEGACSATVIPTGVP